MIWKNGLVTHKVSSANLLKLFTKKGGCDLEISFTTTVANF